MLSDAELIVKAVAHALKTLAPGIKTHDVLAANFVLMLQKRGLAIVPKEPTFEMCQAASAINPEGRSWSLYCVDTYRAMLAAAKGE
jgi:hypothetical protein